MTEIFETICYQWWDQYKFQGIIFDVFFEYVLDLWGIQVTE